MNDEKNSVAADDGTGASSVPDSKPQRKRATSRIAKASPKMKVRIFYRIESPDCPGVCFGLRKDHSSKPILSPNPFPIYFLTLKQAGKAIERTRAFRNMIRESIVRDDPKLKELVKPISFEVVVKKIALA